MQRQIMVLPKLLREKEDCKETLTKLGFVLSDDTIPDCYEFLAPDAWTIEWKGRDGAVFDESHGSVLALWRKTDFWDPIYTMKLTEHGEEILAKTT